MPNLGDDSLCTSKQASCQKDAKNQCIDNRVNTDLIKVCPIPLDKDYELAYDDLVLNHGGKFTVPNNSISGENGLEGYHQLVINADPKELSIKVLKARK